MEHSDFYIFCVPQFSTSFIIPFDTSSFQDAAKWQDTVFFFN